MNSFLVWNVNEAALHTKGVGEDEFTLLRTWPPLGIARREEVRASDNRWRSRLSEILDALNEYFRSGQLTSASPAQVLRDQFLADFLEALVAGTEQSLREAKASSAALGRKLGRWWAENAAEYGARGSASVSFSDLALVVLTSWTNRFLFCHYLKHFHHIATLVDGIRNNCTMEDAEKLFETVSAECDFMHVFGAHPFSEYIGEDSWVALVQFNEFLRDLRLSDLPHDQLGSVLERMLIYSRRKAAGQFVTPPELAGLLVELTMEERRKAVLDPCCGSGRIALAAYEAKRRAGIGVREAMETVWASDKFHFPLQLCTLALTQGESIGETLRVFRSDVFDLKPGKRVALVEPDGGRKVTAELERPVTVVSNLPFVRGEDFDAVNERAHVAPGAVRLSKRADLFARVLLHLSDLVSEHGRIGVIVGNSWLGTEWGQDLRRQLRERFHIETVVVSGAGRWFAEPKVVTTLLVLARGTSQEVPSRFVTLLRPICEWTGQIVHRLADDLDRSEAVETPDYVIRPQPQRLVRVVEDALGGCTALFGKCGWLPEALERLAPIEPVLHGPSRGAAGLERHVLSGRKTRNRARVHRARTSYGSRSTRPPSMAQCRRVLLLEDGGRASTDGTHRGAELDPALRTSPEPAGPPAAAGAAPVEPLLVPNEGGAAGGFRNEPQPGRAPVRRPHGAALFRGSAPDCAGGPSSRGGPRPHACPDEHDPFNVPDRSGRFRPRTECSGSLEGSGGSSVSDPRSPANRPG